LQFSSAVLQSLLNDGGRLGWIGRQVGGQIGFDACRSVQLEDAHAGGRLDGVLSIGEHPDVCRHGVGCCQ